MYSNGMISHSNDNVNIIIAHFYGQKVHFFFTDIKYKLYIDFLTFLVYNNFSSHCELFKGE